MYFVVDGQGIVSSLVQIHHHLGKYVCNIIIIIIIIFLKPGFYSKVKVV